MCNLCGNTGYIDLNEWVGSLEIDDSIRPCPRCSESRCEHVDAPDYPADLVTLMEWQGAR